MSYSMECDTCGTIGNVDDCIEVGGECAHEWCEGTIRRHGAVVKEYHFGVVAIFDESTSKWTFEATWLGADGPFMEMDYEVYDQGLETWECAHMTAETGSVEYANYVLLREAIEIANHRLKEQP